MLSVPVVDLNWFRDDVVRDRGRPVEETIFLLLELFVAD